MLRQNQIGTKATANISTIPMPKRCIWGAAQTSARPPEME